MFTRRAFFRWTVGLTAAGIATGAYGLGIEPFRMVVTRYKFTPKRWTEGLKLRIAILSDIHACEPWVSVPRLRSIVEQANKLNADLILLLGDFAGGHRFIVDEVHSHEWGPVLSELVAPLGVHAVLGNHDWWDDLTAQLNGHGPVYGQVALERAGVRVFENDAIRLVKDKHPFWLAGLGDQLALLPYRKYGRDRWQGMDDLRGTIDKVTDDAPLLLMAHEPDIFPRVPSRVSVTMSGHTHGGQVRLIGWSPVVPSRHRNRYAYGHIIEPRIDGPETSLIVTGGIGCSIMPVRYGVPPEIVLLELGQKADVSS
ncbi:MAG: metallophosphoesterase [Pseudomonadota bacterium]